jgi:hypothetical protein
MLQNEITVLRRGGRLSFAIFLHVKQEKYIYLAFIQYLVEDNAVLPLK